MHSIDDDPEELHSEGILHSGVYIRRRSQGYIQGVTLGRWEVTLGANIKRCTRCFPNSFCLNGNGGGGEWKRGRAGGEEGRRDGGRGVGVQ